jgi:hypothetical protein
LRRKKIPSAHASLVRVSRSASESASATENTVGHNSLLRNVLTVLTLFRTKSHVLCAISAAPGDCFQLREPPPSSAH